MNINIVCIGKIKEAFYREAVSEYAKRLSRFCKFRIIELAEEFCNDISDKNILAVKKAEGERILSQLKGYVIVLDIASKQLDSNALASKISSLKVEGVSDITFVIGGSYGLSPKVLEASNMAISFGLATYPHQLMRVILSEQIYRAFMINEGSCYHK